MVLRQVSDTAAGRNVPRGHAEYCGVTGCLPDNSQQDLDQRGLARTIRPEQPVDLSSGNFEGNASERVHRASSNNTLSIGLLQILDLNYRLSRNHSETFSKRTIPEKPLRRRSIVDVTPGNSKPFAQRSGFLDAFRTNLWNGPILT